MRNNGSRRPSQQGALLSAPSLAAPAAKIHKATDLPPGQPLVVVVLKGGSGYGMELTGGRMHNKATKRIMVKRVVDGSVADIAGVCAGDFVLAIGDDDLEDPVHDDVVETMKTNSRLELHLHRATIQLIKVKLKKLEGKGYGLSLQGDNHEPVTVRNVKQGSVAETNGLKKGDVLLSLNDVSWAGQGQDRASALDTLKRLKEDGDTPKLEVLRGVKSSQLFQLELKSPAEKSSKEPHGVLIGGGSEINTNVPLYVKAVRENSLAETAGIEEGDIVMKVNEKNMTGEKSEKLLKVMQKAKTMSMWVLRPDRASADVLQVCATASREYVGNVILGAV